MSIPLPTPITSLHGPRIAPFVFGIAPPIFGVSQVVGLIARSQHSDPV